MHNGANPTQKPDLAISARTSARPRKLPCRGRTVSGQVTFLGPYFGLVGLVVAFALLASRFFERSLRAVDFMIVRRAAAWMSLDAAIACRDSVVADTLV